MNRDIEKECTKDEDDEKEEDEYKDAEEGRDGRRKEETSGKVINNENIV